MKIKRILVANRGEIAIRIFRAATELGLQTVAIYAEEDKLSLHRFKADEAYRISAGKGPIEAYLSIPDVIAAALSAGADAVHPGYGFLSESPAFARACAEAGLVFVGPSPETLAALGDKVAARNLAVAAGVRVMPATGPLPEEPDDVRRLAGAIGYPLMLKASWGGGGRGMRPIEAEADLLDAVAAARRESKTAFGRDEVYLERLVRRARHVEVQILGDRHGTLIHLFERDCSIQRRNQKVVERAPAPYLDAPTRAALCEAALKLGRATAYVGAGTVEFLLDADTGGFHFIEVNPRIQVEHTVTEEVTGLDLVKAQLRIAAGGRIGHVEETGIPAQDAIRLDGHALQCRITTEDPENGFVPDYGRIIAHRAASGFGIRVDGGTAYAGATVTRHYDPLLEKVTAWAPTAEEAVARMLRALREYRIRGVTTNLAFLEALLGHARFRAMDYTTRFIDETPGLASGARKRDRATRLLTYIADVTVNGHPESRGRPRPARPARPRPDPTPMPSAAPQSGPTPKAILDADGPEALASWTRARNRVLVTDTSLRDAHQSLLATRVRTVDLEAAARLTARALPGLWSLECWGGATFDVALRFLNEDPWDRLARLRAAAPDLMLQMLLRGANAVGYANYPDDVVRFVVHTAAAAGMDVFRVFDCLNWVPNLRVAIDAVREAGKVAEGAICYTGDLTDPARPKYDLRYYVELARELERAGCHILAIKDMAGVLKPAAARVLVRALRDEVGLPIHLHTHDTSGIAGATVLAAVEAGVDVVDLAMDAIAGATSQPCLGSVVEALRRERRDTGLDGGAVRSVSALWEVIRTDYRAFESDLGIGSEVYLHEMPGGQVTNLKEQARSLGLDTRWPEVAEAYRAANDLFGDIVKVTPSSKVVGDMALLMVAQGLTAADVLDPAREVAFPASVVEMMRGDLGQPPGGWPDALQRKALNGAEPLLTRAASLLPPTDFAAARADASALVGGEADDRDLASYLMYPKVFAAYRAARRAYGPVRALPTRAFFYGLEPGEEITAELQAGQALVVSLQAVGETDDDGQVSVFFELNGQPRIVRVPNRAASARRPARRRAEEGNEGHVAAPMPGTVSSLAVLVGQAVRTGDVLLTLEAMKMETILRAPRDGIVAEVLVEPRTAVDAKDLLVVLG